jgi:imidazoleglycerol phosphate dehydratase HisB
MHSSKPPNVQIRNGSVYHIFRNSLAGRNWFQQRRFGHFILTMSERFPEIPVNYSKCKDHSLIQTFKRQSIVHTRNCAMLSIFLYSFDRRKSNNMHANGYSNDVLIS